MGFWDLDLSAEVKLKYFLAMVFGSICLVVAVILAVFDPNYRPTLFQLVSNGFTLSLGYLGGGFRSGRRS
jgi:hypothetical protein